MSAKAVQRVCMTLMIRPEKLDEYKEHHDKIWPEVSHALRSVGVTNLSIFLCPDQPRLILYLEYTRAGEESFQDAMARYGAMPRVQEWEDLMRTCQVQLPGAPAGKWWQDCQELFWMS